MLIQSFVGIAIAIAGYIGLTSFLNSTREKGKISDFHVNNIVKVVAFTTIAVIVMKFVGKLVYGNKEVKEKRSVVKQCKQKKSKSKSKQKRVLKLEREETSDIVKEIDPVGLETNPFAERGEELKGEENKLNVGSINEDTQGVIDQCADIADGEWIDVKKKKRKSHSLMQNIVSNTLDNKNIFSIVDQGGSVQYVTCSNVVEEKKDLKNQYLKQGAKSKTNTKSIQYVGYAKRVSARSPTIESSSEKASVSFIQNKGDIKLKNTVLSSVDFNQKSDFISVCSDRSYSALVESRSVSGGVSDVYKKLAIKFCSSLKTFRQLHFIYCIRLMKQIFKVENNKLMISEDINDFFTGLTSHTEVLFFIFKIFFLGNISILCGAKDLIDNIRYCSTYFYDQSLLDVLISEVIMNVSETDNLLKGTKIKERFEFHCRHLQGMSSYTPYSGKFFQQVFNMCYDLASVNCEEKQELVDLAELACVVYCGHMFNMIFRMLIYNNNAKGGAEDPLVKYLKAQRFCRQCTNLRAAMVHMYHPINEEDCPRNVGNVIDVPSIIWKNCSKGIHDVVKESVSQNKISFGIFVKDMVSSIKTLILVPSTGRLYKEDIKTYENKIKTVPTLAPLQYTRLVCIKEEKLEGSKSL
ncbi:DUF3514 domain-containing protein [Ehrlichia sp. JZT12]